jgi:hypothetical protein
MTRCCNRQDVCVSCGTEWERRREMCESYLLFEDVAFTRFTVDIGNLTFGLAHAVRMMMCTPLSESTTPDISPT